MDVSIDIDKIINARLIELNSLSKEIKQKSNKLILQRLPRYMRRRASSHNPKRLPSKFIKHPLPLIGNSASKEKKRKQRKKHVNKIKLKSSILKRNNKSNRTILHIWFRKRFKLIDQLNYLIPFKNNNKNFRNLHNVSIKQCAYYYRPINKSIEIKFNDNQQLNDAIQLINDNYLLNDHQLIQQCSNSELNLFFYNQNKILCSIYLLMIIDNHSLILTVPVNQLKFIKQLLDQLFVDANLKFTIYDNQYERFTLIGPKSSKYLFNLLNTLSDQQNNEINNLTFKSDCSIKIIDESKFLGKQINLIYLIKDKSIVDILIPRKLTKKFWYNLIKNRSHLVGGLVDYEYYALQNDSLTYPTIGFLDLQKDHSKFKILNLILKSINLQRKFEIKNNDNQCDKQDKQNDDNDQNEDKQNEDDEQNDDNNIIIRSTKFLKLCESPFLNLNKIEQIMINDDLMNNFVNVKLKAIKKGVIEENDLIYLPTVEDLIKLNKLINSTKEERYLDNLDDDIDVEENKLKKLKISTHLNNDKQLLTILNRSSRTVIGIVEIGKFSLKSGRSESFGVLCLKSILELIKLNRNNFNNLNVLVRSERSTKYRFCSLMIKDFKIL